MYKVSERDMEFPISGSGKVGGTAAARCLKVFNLAQIVHAKPYNQCITRTKGD